jgi:Tfp pilus assembly protein PilF
MKKSLSFIFVAILLTAGFCTALRCENDATMEKARELINAKNYADAVTMLQKLQADNPESVEINLTLGLVCLQTERYFVAEDCFLRVVRIDPKSVSAHYSLAMIYEKNKRFVEAVREWESVKSNTSDKTLIEFVNRHIKFAEAQLK